MSTTCPLETIAELSDELKHYYAFGVDTQSAASGVLTFIYAHQEQDNILDFLYVLYTQLVINGVVDINLLRRTTKEFLNSSSLDRSVRDYTLGSLIDEDKGSDKLLSTIKLLRFYLPQLDTVMLQVKNFKI